jgi:hypothetical protein
MRKWSIYLSAIVAAIASIAEVAAQQRVVFNVSGSPTCQGFFGNTTVKSLSIDKNALADGTFNDGLLFVTIDFDPATNPTEILSWTNATVPPAPSGYTPKRVNAVIVKTGATPSGDTKIAFYPEPVTSDPTFAAVLDGTKAINQLIFCHSMTGGGGELGYAACPLSSTTSPSLASVCTSLPEASYFVVNNLADIARGGVTESGDPSKPAFCACPGQTRRDCSPVAGSSDSCLTPGVDVLNSVNTEQQTSTEGSCIVTACTSFFGRQICTQSTTTSPRPPC